MRLRGRLDNNHKEVVAAFRDAGYSVLSLAAMGKGVPDLLVSVGEETYLVEVKDGKSKTLTPEQIKFHSNWIGRIEIVTCLEDVRGLIDGTGKEN